MSEATFQLPEFSPESDFAFFPTVDDSGIIFALKEFAPMYAILSDFNMKDADDETGDGILDFEMKFIDSMPEEVKKVFEERVSDCLLSMLQSATQAMAEVQE